MSIIKKFVTKPVFSPTSLFLATSLIALLYLFMEWTYNIDKSSLASAGLFGEKLLILFSSAAILAILCLVIFLPFFLLNRLVKSEKALTVIRWVFALIPATLLTTILLLIVDNTTYTLWSKGIVTSRGWIRGLYAVIYILGLAFLLTRAVRFTNNIHKSLQKSSKKTKRSLPWIVSAVCLVLIVLPIATNPNLKMIANLQPAGSETGKKPNIILITVDSLNAEKMSLYGFTKETTPFLEELAASSLVGENHFSNAQGTIGSLTSLLTGKYPADERVLASSDLLEGKNAYQHLPGILKEYGYDTVQLSYSYYADAENLNIRDGFDLANGESTTIDPFSSAITSALPTRYYYFLREVCTRATDRVGHIFFLKTMRNPYKQMTESPDKFDDAYKLETALSLLEESQKPLFIHIHWMGTHGPKYYPEKQVFSAGEDPQAQKDRMDVFYYDSILEFDTSLADFYAQLQEAGMEGDTLLIVTADHTQRWSNSRLPLVIHFPDGEYTGRIASNTENLDIAPTILDYLGVETPSWMPGQSLLSINDTNRPIFIAQIGDSKKNPDTGKVTYPPITAPFYQFGKISVVSCDTWYKLNLNTLIFSTGAVKKYAGECPEGAVSARAALNLIIGHLQEYGFDTSSIVNVEIPD